MPFTPRHLGAALGMVAAVATIAVIVLRLVDGAAPTPISVVMSSASATPLTVESLEIAAQRALPERWVFPAARVDANQAGGAQSGAQSGTQSSVGLRVGRPATAQARLSAPQAAVLTCVLEPRPHGQCMLNIKFEAATDMRCSYECQTEALKP